VRPDLGTRFGDFLLAGCENEKAGGRTSRPTRNLGCDIGNAHYRRDLAGLGNATAQRVQRDGCDGMALGIDKLCHSKELFRVPLNDPTGQRYHHTLIYVGEGLDISRRGWARQRSDERGGDRTE
jgi:hypothetical protein